MAIPIGVAVSVVAMMTGRRRKAKTKERTRGIQGPGYRRDRVGREREEEDVVPAVWPMPLNCSKTRGLR